MKRMLMASPLYILAIIPFTIYLLLTLLFCLIGGKDAVKMAIKWHNKVTNEN